MFLSAVFSEAFVNSINVPVELYNNDGSTGAALGAGIGAGIFSNAEEAFDKTKPLAFIEPTATDVYEEIYQQWRTQLLKQLL